MDRPEKVWCIVVNSNGDKVYPTGAKLRIVDIGWDAKSVEVYGASRGKRWVRKWVQTKTLKDFRPGWVPPKLRESCGKFLIKEQAEAEIMKHKFPMKEVVV